MKFQEPLAGYKLASGETLYHIIYAVAIILLILLKQVGDCVDD